MSHPPQRPGRTGRASNIRGPQSALTDFLAAHNIDANRIRHDADTRRAAAAASREAALLGEEENAAVSTPAASDFYQRRETKGQREKREKEEKSIAKIKASKSFQRRRMGLSSDDSEPEDEAARGIYDLSKSPLPGQMENCALCDVRFTVTAYSRQGPSGGLLCPKCSKELDKDTNFVQKKKKATVTRVNRRGVQSKILDGTYQTGAKDLLTLCVETLANNVDLAEELGDLPQSLVSRLEFKLSQKRLIGPSTLDLFLTPKADSISVNDGARLSSDDYIRIFQTSPNIKELTVRNSVQFKNNVMEYLVGCPLRLESLSLHGANLIDDEHWTSFIIEKGKYLRKLRVMFTDNHFGDSELEAVKISCSQLTSLKISHNQKVTDEGVKHISGLPYLKSLVLELTNARSLISSATYAEVIQSVGAGLEKLTLKNIYFVADDVLEAIHNNCRQLKKLRLSPNQNFTDSGFAQLFTNWNNSALEEVDLYKCAYVEASDPHGDDNSDGVGLQDAGFEALMAHSGQKLRSLRIASCRHISFESFEKVFSAEARYPNLTHMDVSFIPAVNDFVVGSIFRSCPVLKDMKVFGNFGVTTFKASKGKLLIGMPNAMGMQIEGEEE